MVMIAKCGKCGLYGGNPCDRCERLACVGTIVTAIGALEDAWNSRRIASDPSGLDDLSLDVLDAVAFMLRERSIAVDRLRRDIRDEQKAAQRDAVDAYREGKYDGLHER